MATDQPRAKETRRTQTAPTYPHPPPPPSNSLATGGWDPPHGDVGERVRSADLPAQAPGVRSKNSEAPLHRPGNGHHCLGSVALGPGQEHPYARHAESGSSQLSDSGLCLPRLLNSRRARRGLEGFSPCFRLQALEPACKEPRTRADPGARTVARGKPRKKEPGLQDTCHRLD